MAHNTITDLSPFSELNWLQRLNLEDNPLEDLSLLNGMPMLREVYIKNCSIKRQSLEAFRKENPDCRIEIK